MLAPVCRSSLNAAAMSAMDATLRTSGDKTYLKQLAKGHHRPASQPATPRPASSHKEEEKDACVIIGAERLSRDLYLASFDQLLSNSLISV